MGAVVKGEAYLGIDIGGLSLKGIRLEGDGRISLRRSVPTPAAGGAGAVLAALGDLVAGLMEPGPVAAIGAGTPGGVGQDGRISGDAANIPGWIGTDLRAALAGFARADIPIEIRNDGNLAAYAEWAIRGAASECLLFIGMGTGIGGGFVERGSILSGRDDMAVEIGHVVVFPDGRPCACGVRGCGEAYASGPSIARIASERAMEGRFDDSALARNIRSGIAIEAKHVYEAFASGDSLALAVDGMVIETLARLCATGIALFAPDCVVLGGGVMRGAAHLPAEVARRTRGLVYESAYRGTRFEAAACGHEAGLVGAALFGARGRIGGEALFRLAGRAFSV